MIDGPGALFLDTVDLYVLIAPGVKPPGIVVAPCSNHKGRVALEKIVRVIDGQGDDLGCIQDLPCSGLGMKVLHFLFTVIHISQTRRRMFIL